MEIYRTNEPLKNIGHVEPNKPFENSTAKIDVTDKVTIQQVSNNSSSKTWLDICIDSVNDLFKSPRVYESDTPEDVLLKATWGGIRVGVPTFVGVSALWGTLLLNPLLGIPFGLAAAVANVSINVSGTYSQPVLPDYLANKK
jgi:hypothetical protein